MHNVLNKFPSICQESVFAKFTIAKTKNLRET